MVNAMAVPTYKETPETTNENREYVFYKNGSVGYYINKKLQASYNYEIDYEFRVTNYPSDSSTVIIFRNVQNNFWLIFTGLEFVMIVLS